MAAAPPLAGMRVLVTRPVEQANGLCGMIETAGGVALRLPMLEIVALESADAALLGQPGAWDWWIFVSANAVRHACPRIDRVGLRQAGTRVAAVGEATARALVDNGIRVDLIPEPQFNSEALLAMPTMADVAGKRILIVRGQGGREHLATILRERGAAIRYAEVYRRICPAGDHAGWIERWRNGGIDAATLTSGEALSHLMAWLGPHAAEFAANIPLVTLGARVAELARQQGWQRVTATETASDQAIVDALLRMRRA